MYLCVCKALRPSDVERAARSSGVAPQALIAGLGLDDPRCCGRCARRIDRFIVLATTALGRMGQEAVAPAQQA